MNENLEQEFNTLERHVNKDAEENKATIKDLRKSVKSLRSRVADQERYVAKMKPYYKLMLGLQSKMNNFGKSQSDDGNFVHIDEEASNEHHKEPED